VVLADTTRVELEEALTKVRFHRTIYEDWGFGVVDSTGGGVTLNLYGPPGTGKTRAAEAVAGEMRRPILHLSAGDLESRYMGETAKNIQAVFRETQASGAVLFFDEADSLFGRRASEVTQGVDHEVNVSKSTLLVEMDRFEGVLVLATNYQQNFDRAFVRRISHHIHFRLPDRAARHALWSMHLVAGVPLAEEREGILEFATDASEGLSGGDVLTAMRLALPAALLAAPSSPRLRRGDLAAAIERVRRARAEVAVEVRRASPEALASFFNDRSNGAKVIEEG
jgi:SpoVK/Ycf46/Vps4 family AAA+-type ATPase